MNFLSGYKTYILSALAVVWTLVYLWGWLDLTPEWFLSVLTALAGGTTWAVRASK